MPHRYFKLVALRLNAHPQVLPIVIFFSTVMSMLYYLGLMQWIIRKVPGLEGSG